MSCKAKYIWLHYNICRVRYDNLLKEYKQLCDDHHNVLRMKKEVSTNYSTYFLDIPSIIVVKKCNYSAEIDKRYEARK